MKIMEKLFRLVFFSSCLLWLSEGQYHAQYRQPAPQFFQPQFQQQKQPVYSAPDPGTSSSVSAPEIRTPPSAILSHRQSLTHNGGFNYAFAADNGLQQGESIAPDGTRSGGYSYVDPAGKTISVKYTAGKEGFRILEGEHIPRNPEAEIAGPSPAAAGPSPAQISSRPSGPAPYLRSGAPQTFAGSSGPSGYSNGPRYQLGGPGADAVAPLPRYLTYKAAASDETALRANAVQTEPEYNDEPGKPHSFGSGYSFEFSG